MGSLKQMKEMHEFKQHKKKLKKTNKGKKMCPECKKLFPLEEIAEHILSHKDEVPASHTQVEAFEDELNALNKENGEISEQNSQLNARIGRAEMKATIYRQLASDLILHLKAILDSEQEF